MVIEGTVGDVCAALSPHLRVVVPADRSTVPFRGRFVDVSIDDILRTMAGAMGDPCDVRQRDGFVYVGPPTDADRVSAVFPVAQGDGGDWAGLYQLGGMTGNEVRTKGDLVIIRDTLRGIDRVTEMHNALSRVRRQYMVELCFLELSEDQLAEFGVKLNASGVSKLTVGASGDVSLEAILTATLKGMKNRVKSSQVNMSRLHVVEGAATTQVVGGEINVPRRSVSPEGTVTDVGYDKFQTGSQIKISARGLADGLIRLEVNAEMSELEGLSQNLPQINRRTFDCSAFVGSGGVIVVGGLQRQADEISGDQVPATGIFTSKSRRERSGRLYLFLKLNEV